MSGRRIVTGRRLAVVGTLLVVVILAAPIGFLHLRATPPPPPQAFQKPRDAAVSVLWPLWLFGVRPCSTHRVDTGVVIHASLPTDQCFKMEPPRRFSGIWHHEFEGSTFLKGVTQPAEAMRRLCELQGRAGPAGEWLDWSVSWRELDPALRSALDGSSGTRLVYLEFEGRRTAYRGDYGHLGTSETEVIVDRLITARLASASGNDDLSCETP